jgi:hypothetical protein
MRSWCIDLNFLDLGTSWRLVVSFTPLPLYSWRKNSGTLWVGGWVDSIELVQTTWRRENSWYRDLNSKPSVVQPVASRYTDYAIPDLLSSGTDEKAYCGNTLPCKSTDLISGISVDLPWQINCVNDSDKGFRKQSALRSFHWTSKSTLVLAIARYRLNERSVNALITGGQAYRKQGWMTVVESRGLTSRRTGPPSRLFFCFLLPKFKYSFSFSEENSPLIFFLILFLVGWDWVSWYWGHYWPIVPAPDDRWWWLWRNWWNEDWHISHASQRSLHDMAVLAARALSILATNPIILSYNVDPLQSNDSVDNVRC